MLKVFRKLFSKGGSLSSPLINSDEFKGSAVSSATPTPTLATNKKDKEQQSLERFLLLRRAQASVQFLLVDGENNTSGFTPSHSDVLYMLDNIADNLAQLEKVVANGGGCE